MHVQGHDFSMSDSWARILALVVIYFIYKISDNITPIYPISECYGTYTGLPVSSSVGMAPDDCSFSNSIVLNSDTFSSISASSYLSE